MGEYEDDDYVEGRFDEEYGAVCPWRSGVGRPLKSMYQSVAASGRRARAVPVSAGGETSEQAWAGSGHHGRRGDGIELNSCMCG